jgi:hypothetical protein
MKLSNLVKYENIVGATLVVASDNPNKQGIYLTATTNTYKTATTRVAATMTNFL